MSIKPDAWIIRKCMGLPEDVKPMIEPFTPHQVRTDEEGRKILSYGTSSYGYDVTLARKFAIFTNLNSAIIDPLDFDEKCLVEVEGDYVILPPNSYLLGVTNEYFRIPKNVMVVCVGKSTGARAGMLVNTTPIEPGFEGNVVIEISNATSLPMKIYANMGVAQFMFFESDEECTRSYADGQRKYQGQTGIVTPKV
jgi:dCTP deaminase